jgi:hypothetical protein
VNRYRDILNQIAFDYSNGDELLREAGMDARGGDGVTPCLLAAIIYLTERVTELEDLLNHGP